MKQYQKEVNELRAERIAKNANPLALVATAQTHPRPYYQSSKSHKSYATYIKASLLERDKEHCKKIWLALQKYVKKIYKPTNNNLRTSSNTRNKNVDTTSRYKNDNKTGQFGNQRAERCSTSSEQSDWLQTWMKKLKIKSWKHITLHGKEILELDVDENKKIQKQLKKANVTLTQELTEYKSILAETSRTLWESNSIRDSCLVTLQIKQTEFERYKAFNDRIVDYDKLEQIVNQAWVKHSNDLLHLRNPTAQDMEILVKTCLMPLALKTQNDSFAFVHELKQEMHADLKYVESLEDELDELESDKAEFSNMYDMLLQECVSKDVMCSYLQSSSDLDEITELQCLYLHKVRECDCLAQKLSEQTEFVSKEIYTELLRSFAKLEKHSISLEIALQQCQEQLKNDIVYKEKASNVFRKECEQYFEIQDLKAQLQDKNITISELKKLIDKCKGKSVDTKFDKLSVVRQPNAQM
ncbi:hypothetical protein Tco_0111287 [Tanacetum coccineum]